MRVRSVLLIAAVGALALVGMLVSRPAPSDAVGPISFVQLLSSEDEGKYSSLKLNGSGYPIISYWDETNKDLQVYNGQTSSLYAPDTSDDVGEYTSLALDGSGNPVVSYYDRSNGYLKVLHCNDPECAPGGDSITTPDTSADVGGYTSLVLSGGNPIVSYYDFSTGLLKLLFCDDPNCSGGDPWATVDAAGDVGQFTSLAIGAGRLAISYYDATNGNLKVFQCTPTDLTTCTSTATINSPDGADNVGQWTSLAIDAAGNPVVSYWDLTFNQLRVAHCANPSCSSATITGVDCCQVGAHTSLVLDAAGKPAISYYDLLNGHLKVARCGNANCSAGNVLTAVTFPSGNTGGYSSLALNSSGLPIISFYDYDNTDLQYVVCENPYCADKFTKDGFKIAFSSDRDGEAEIYSMNSGGAGQARLTNNTLPAGFAADYRPTWSPDGTKIAFTREDGCCVSTQIYVMNADGSGQTDVSIPAGGDSALFDSDPAWSPDGTKIAFAANSFVGSGEHILVMNPDGTGRTDLTPGLSLGEKSIDPTWSPDGTKIAFQAIRTGDSSDQIYVMNANGSGLTRLSANIGSADVQPAWSPDGKRIAFASNYPGNWEIYTFKTDGSDPVRLTTNGAVDDEPAWKTDGTLIAFRSNRDGNDEVYRMNATNGSGQTNISNNPANDSDPAWRRVSGPPGVDFDLDGCTDAKEAGPNTAGGGLRNPQSFWDFFDVWTHPVGMPTVWERTKTVNLNEINAIAKRFAQVGSPSANPLIPPTSDTNYHVASDRTAVAGQDQWRLGPPDGSIGLTDINLAAKPGQIFANCN